MLTAGGLSLTALTDILIMTVEAGNLKDQKCGQSRVFIVAVSCVSGAAAYLAL
jgi:hypothetical protein